MKLKGLKAAVGDYQRANKGGSYSAWYGRLMLDKEAGDLWTDEFYSLGHNEWREYHSEEIINLVAWERDRGDDRPVCMATVKEWAVAAIKEG